jgi:hypothetical protein
MKHVILNDKTIALVHKMQAELNTTVKLSNTSKLGVKSWSLQALNTCPASIGNDGELVDACKGCYATSGNYRFANVRAPREFNKQAWQDDSFVNDFVNELYKERFFRWFDSGDMYNIKLAEKMLEIMERTPHVKHWLPTRMYKFKKFHSIIEQMQALDNVVVRLSSDHIDGTKVDSAVSDTNSVIIPADQAATYTDGFVCSAYMQDGKCLTCTACYDKDIKTVAYVGHGKSMLKNQSKLINTVSI